jgi:selenocysteine lyase/cysteine desulfurase
MNDTLPRRYLDNAATTWPKPPEVVAAWRHAAEVVGATAGRGAYRNALQASATLVRARTAAARLLGGVDASRVAIPSGCTLALNTAIHGTLRPGDHVIATAADHNATLRPLHWLASRGVIEWTIVPCDGRGWVDPDAIAAAWRPATRMVVVSHASNVTGVVQDVAAITAIAHERDGVVLLDAAQSLGQVPCDQPAWDADIVAAPSHKWLLGMSGAAILWAREGLEIEPLVQGGTGTMSDSLDMPLSFIDRMEAGSPDVPAAASLEAAIQWLETKAIQSVGEGCRRLADACAGELSEITGVRVLGGMRGPPIVSFTVEGYDPADVAAILESTSGVQVRAGFHCAARVHDHLGTQAGGTVRASFGPFNTREDVNVLVEQVHAIATG